jgi:hypothetical protein
MTEEELYELRKIELGGEELASAVWGDFCDWYGERLMIYWFQAAIWWQDMNVEFEWRARALLTQLFGGTRILRKPHMKGGDA